MNNTLQIKQSIPSFVFLPNDRIEEAANLYAICLINLNAIWKKSGVTYQQAFQYYMSKMTNYTTKWSSAIIKDNVLVTATYSLDLVDYMKSFSMPISKSQLFRQVTKTATGIETQYYQNLNAKRGQYLVGIIAGVRPEYGRHGIGHRMYAGWKAYVCRASNYVTAKAIVQFGGKILSTSEVKLPEMKGQTFYFLRLDFDDLKVDEIMKIAKQIPVKSSTFNFANL